MSDELRYPTIEQLIDATMRPVDPYSGDIECICGAGAGWPTAGPIPCSETLCEECLSELFDELNPTRIDDDDAYGRWLDVVGATVDGL